MEKLTFDNLTTEITDIRKRIIEKQSNLEEMFCGEQPVEFQREIFEIVFDINHKVSSFEFVTSFAVKEFNFINPKINTKSIMKKVKQAVEMVLSNYYFDLAETVRKVIIELSKKEFMKEEIDELRELKDSIGLNQFIINHKEYEKISQFICYSNALNEIECSRINKLYNLLGLKTILLEYEKHLKDISKLNDFSLRRAVLAYVEDCMDNSYFIIL